MKSFCVLQSDLLDIAMKEMADEDVLQKKEMNSEQTKGLMEKEVSNRETYHMNSDDDLYSYGKYSCYQVLFLLSKLIHNWTLPKGCLKSLHNSFILHWNFKYYFPFYWFIW